MSNNGKLTALRKTLLSKNAFILYALAAGYAVLAALVYTGSASRQLSGMITTVSCYIVLGVSLNLVVGLLGELSLGHAGFMSVGLYAGCLFSIATADVLPLLPRMLLSMLLGGLAAAAVGLVVGLPALRLKGDYLAIVTLACGEIIKNAITNFKFTGGALGLNTGSIYEKTKALFPYAVLIVFVTILVVMNMKRSRHGRAIMAIRDNRIAAESCGINATYYKLLAFVVAAFFAGVAGVLYGHTLANVNPSTFDYNMSIEILVIVVLGGMGNIGGSVLAAIVLQVLPEALRDFADLRMLIYSVLLIAIMLLNASPRFKEFKGRWSLRTLFLAARKGNDGKEAQK